MKRKAMETIEINGVRAEVARTFWQRFKGLIGWKSLPCSILCRKFVLLVVVTMISPIAVASAGNDRKHSFVEILGYMLAGGLGSWLAGRRVAARKEKCEQKDRCSGVAEINNASNTVEMISVGEDENVAADDAVKCAFEVEMTPVDENEIECAAVTTDTNCTFCGRIVSDDETYGVDFDNYRMQDGSRSSMELLIPCCTSCHEKMSRFGADMIKVRKFSAVEEAIRNGACFSGKWLEKQNKIRDAARLHNSARFGMDDGSAHSVLSQNSSNDRLIDDVKTEKLSQWHKQHLKSLLDDEEYPATKGRGGSFLEMYCRAWASMTCYQGQSSREEYWKFAAIDAVVAVVLGFVMTYIGAGPVLKLYIWISIFPRIPLSIRRFRDAGSSVRTWIGLHLAILVSGVATVRMGNMRAIECPVLLFALMSVVFMVAAIAVVKILCSRSHDSDDDNTIRRQSWLRLAVKWLLCLGVLGALVVFVRNIRVYLKDADENEERFPEIRKRVAPRVNGDGTYQMREHYRHIRSRPAIDSTNGELKAGQPCVTILSNIEIPIPADYRVVEPGTSDDIALSVLDTDPTPEGDTKLRLMRVGSGEYDKYDGMLKVAVNRRLIGSMISQGNFRILASRLASEFEALKNKRNIRQQTIRDVRDGIRGNAKPTSEDVLSAIEVLSVRNDALEGLFTSCARREISKTDVREDAYWILVTQGVILVKGRILIVIRYKRYEDYDSALRNASRGEAVVRDWCRGIRRRNY